MGIKILDATMSDETSHYVVTLEWSIGDGDGDKYTTLTFDEDETEKMEVVCCCLDEISGSAYHSIQDFYEESDLIEEYFDSWRDLYEFIGVPSDPTTDHQDDCYFESYETLYYDEYGREFHTEWTE